MTIRFTRKDRARNAIYRVRSIAKLHKADIETLYQLFNIEVDTRRLAKLADVPLSQWLDMVGVPMSSEEFWKAIEQAGISRGYRL